MVWLTRHVAGNLLAPMGTHGAHNVMLLCFFLVSRKSSHGFNSFVQTNQDDQIIIMQYPVSYAYNLYYTIILCLYLILSYTILYYILYTIQYTIYNIQTSAPINIHAITNCPDAYYICICVDGYPCIPFYLPWCSDCVFPVCVSRNNSDYNLCFLICATFTVFFPNCN